LVLLGNPAMIEIYSIHVRDYSIDSIDTRQC
jgi:hypothetical protein